MLKLHQAPPEATRIDIGRGVTITLRRLDSIQHATIVGAVQRDIATLREGQEPDAAWPLDDEERAALEDPVVREAVARWMHMTLLAATAADAVEGVEGGAADLETFAWLFRDDVFLQMFRLKAYAIESLYVAEGNASGSGPAGSGAMASTTAPDAAPSTNDAPRAAAAADGAQPIFAASDAGSDGPDAGDCAGLPSSAPRSAAPGVPQTSTPPAPISGDGSGSSPLPPASGCAAA